MSARSRFRSASFATVLMQVWPAAHVLAQVNATGTFSGQVRVESGFQQRHFVISVIAGSAGNADAGILICDFDGSIGNRGFARVGRFSSRSGGTFEPASGRIGDHFRARFSPYSVRVGFILRRT